LWRELVKDGNSLLALDDKFLMDKLKIVEARPRRYILDSIASLENPLANWTSKDILFWLKEDLGLPAINDELWRQNVPNVQKLVNLT